MVYHQDNLQILVDLGLTLLQAKIYATLVETGTAKAETISKVSNVSRPDVYRIICKLQEAGLVEVDIEKPVMYRAISPEIAAEILLERQKNKFDALKIKSKSLLKNLPNHRANDSREESKFVFVPSKETLIRRLKSAVDGTQKTIDVVTSCKRLKYACYCLSESLEKAWNRNVQGRALIEDPEMNQTEIFEKVWRQPTANVRIIPEVPPAIIAMYDQKEVFIFTEPTADLRDSPALWSNSPSVLFLTTYFFESMWTQAQPLKNVN